MGNSISREDLNELEISLCKKENAKIFSHKPSFFSIGIIILTSALALYNSVKLLAIV